MTGLDKNLSFRAERSEVPESPDWFPELVRYFRRFSPDLSSNVFVGEACGNDDFSAGTTCYYFFLLITEA
jgi:hypothetical protein